MTETVWLQRPSSDEPWGFRLQGGRDYQAPLSVQKVTTGSIAATGLGSGDVILRIGDADTASLTYAQAMQVVKDSGNLLQLSVSKQSGQYSQPSQVDADTTSNMTSGALHDLFQDLYRYSDPATYPQEGAHTHSNPSNPYPPPAPYSQPGPYQPPAQAARSHGTAPGPGVQPSDRAYSDHGYGSPVHQYTGQPSGQSFPPQGPPTYTDVQSHRDQVSYPYQPAAQPAGPQYPYTGASAAPNYPYPHSVSSSTSELSDISSGIGTSDGGKPCGSSPALGGAPTKPYTSASSVDSSSGVGSYRCDTPEQLENVFQSRQPHLGRQDSFPPPPPPFPEEASANTSDTPLPGTPLVPVVAPPPAPPLPPPAPPLPTQSWKSKQNGDHNKQQPQQPPTRLQQQLSNMSLDSDYGRQNSFPPPPPSAYQPASPQPQAYTSGSAPHYGGQSPAVSGQAPQYGGYPAYTPPSPSAAQPARPMPDAVLNMAAKGEPDKKPWAYAPDMDVIKEQRDKVRRRAPAGGMPKYQQLLNMPQFDDPPPARRQTGPKTPTTPTQAPDYAPGPGEANVAHLQYNSPMQLYSEDNVGEAFTGQTDGVVTGVHGVKQDQGQDITQSPVYRMIHGLDAAKPKPRPVAPEVGAEKPTRRPADDDELTFTGVSRSDIPSKSFQRLQSMTGSSDVDTTSIRGNVAGVDTLEPQGISNYDQTSIRYTGRNIPSKSFRMLQSLTGPEPNSLQVPGPRRQRRRQEQPEPQQNPDDTVDISYVGGNIPSRSFKVLQHAMGQPDYGDQAQQTVPYNSCDTQNGGSNQGRTVKVIKLRQQDTSDPSGVTDF